MNARGVLARAVVSEIVLVYAIDDVFDSALPAYFLQTIEQFVFAVKTAVGIIGDVFGILELECRDVLMPNPVLFGKKFGVTFVGFGDGCRVRRNCYRSGPQRPLGGPCE